MRLRDRQNTGPVRDWLPRPASQPFVGDLVTYGNAAVTASGSANTKGSWSSVINFGIPRRGTYLQFRVDTLGQNGINTATLIDFGISPDGNSANVVPIVENIAIGGHNANNTTWDSVGFGWIGFPVQIPRGAALHARIQSSYTSASTNIPALIYDFGNYDRTPKSVDVLGISTATSQGTTLSTTSGTWTQIIASTTKSYAAFIPVPSLADSAVTTGNTFVHQVGIGPAGNETGYAMVGAAITASETMSIASTPGVIGRPQLFTWTGPVTAGERIVMRQFGTSLAETVQGCVIAVPEV